MEYDGLDHLIRTVDNDRNTNEFAYDSRNNRTLHIDAMRRNNASDPGNIVRNTYDGVNRLVSTTRLLTDDDTILARPTCHWGASEQPLVV